MPCDLASSIKITDLSKAEKHRFKSKYDTFFFDIDGTLIQQYATPIPGANDAISAIYSCRKDIYVVTDKGEFTRERTAKNISLLFPEIKQEHVLTTQWLITHYLKSIGFNKKIYAIGSKEGIINELIDAGFNVLYDEEVTRTNLKEIFEYELDTGVGAVVVGTDFNFNYIKLFKAVNYLSDPSVHFLASHAPLVAFRDPIIPVAGALTVPIEAVTGRKARTFGKETEYSIEYLRGLGYDMKRCLFIGDSPESDLVCGSRCGMDTLWVQGGTFNMADLQRALQKGRIIHPPTYVAGSVADLVPIFS